MTGGGGSLDGSTPRSRAAILSLCASSARRCWPIVFTIPAVIPPMIATMGMAMANMEMKLSELMRNILNPPVSGCDKGCAGAPIDGGFRRKLESTPLDREDRSCGFRNPDPRALQSLETGTHPGPVQPRGAVYLGVSEAGRR